MKIVIGIYAMNKTPRFVRYNIEYYTSPQGDKNVKFDQLRVSNFGWDKTHLTRPANMLYDTPSDDIDMIEVNWDRDDCMDIIKALFSK